MTINNTGEGNNDILEPIKSPSIKGDVDIIGEDVKEKVENLANKSKRIEKEDSDTAKIIRDLLAKRVADLYNEAECQLNKINVFGEYISEGKIIGRAFDIIELNYIEIKKETEGHRLIMESLAGRQMSEEELARKYIGLLYMSLNELLRKISIGRKHEFCGIQALYKIKEVLTK